MVIGDKFTIKVATFVAFNQERQMPFFNKNDAEIMEELLRVCSTMYMFSIDTYEATFTEQQVFNEGKISTEGEVRKED
jgi:hypothetical protein